MTTETQTTAEQIAAEFGDGMTTRVTRGCTCGVGTTARGHGWDCAGEEITIDAACIAAHGGRVGRRLASDFDRRYEFADGSVIVTHSGIWDLGLADRECGCWAGEGHSPECDAEHEPVALAVTDMSTSHEGRVITLEYTRAPEPDEEMDARAWREVKDRYTTLALKQIAQHGRAVEIYASAPDCQDWMIDEIRPEVDRDEAAAMERADYDI